MPHREGDDKRNVLLNQMPQNFDAYALDEAAMDRWATAMKLRQDVNGVLELARGEKRIGKALEAHVTLSCQETLQAATANMNLAELFIVSSVTWSDPEEGALTGTGSNFTDVTIGVSEAKGGKCPRCWMHSLDANVEGLCKRCAAVISKMDLQF
jgi:isoleucyl-tRNA synthetase